MTDPVLDQPIFVIGMPRSGTTIVFEALARHPDLAWPSNYCRTHPHQPRRNLLRGILDNSLLHLHGNKKQYGSVSRLNLWLPQPDEAYEFWDAWSGREFGRSALHGECIDDEARLALRNAISSVVRSQGRRRFAAKLTGPPRIQFLRSVFPDARFVHVLRDGHAVVHSLLKVPFWREKGGYDGPFWKGVMDERSLAAWQAGDKDPGELTAMQWARIVAMTWAEAATLPEGCLHEVRYEEFVADPHGVLRSVHEACGLDDAAAVHEWLDAGPALRNMNGKSRDDFAPEYFERLSRAMQPQLCQSGYAAVTQATPSAGHER